MACVFLTTGLRDDPVCCLGTCEIDWNRSGHSRLMTDSWYSVNAQQWIRLDYIRKLPHVYRTDSKECFRVMVLWAVNTRVPPALLLWTHIPLLHRKVQYRVFLGSISFTQVIFRQAGGAFSLSCCSSCLTVAMETKTPSELCALSGVQPSNTLAQFNPLTPLASETVNVSKLDSFSQVAQESSYHRRLVIGGLMLKF